MKHNFSKSLWIAFQRFSPAPYNLGGRSVTFVKQVVQRGTSKIFSMSTLGKRSLVTTVNSLSKVKSLPVGIVFCVRHVRGKV